jgi:hypothetical protein
MIRQRRAELEATSRHEPYNKGVEAVAPTLFSLPGRCYQVDGSGSSVRQAAPMLAAGTKSRTSRPSRLSSTVTRRSSARRSRTPRHSAKTPSMSRTGPPGWTPAGKPSLTKPCSPSRARISSTTPLGNGTGWLPTTTRLLTPETRLYRPPAVARDIHGDKQIARKERTRDRLGAPGMAAGAQIAREVGHKALPAQIDIGAVLALGLGMHHIPSHAHRPSLPAADGAAATSGGTRNIAGAWTARCP